LIIGLVLVLLGVLVLAQPVLLPIVVGLALILGGLWIAPQNARVSGRI